MDLPFHWKEGATVSIAVTTASGNVALAKMPTGRTQIRLHNAGAATVFVAKGASSSITALTTDMPIPAGGVEVFTFNNNEASPITHIAAITAAGTATLYITTGIGD